MKRLKGIYILAVCSVLFGQTNFAPRWIGTWRLNVQESTFGPILMPGVPADLKIVGQTLTIEQAGSDVMLSGDAVTFYNNGSHTDHYDLRLKLDGTPTSVGPISLSFRRIDDSTFEMISAVNIPNHNLGEVSRFAFSTDGKKLTETKTQTEREMVPEGADKSAGRVIRTSKFVLVFSRLPEP